MITSAVIWSRFESYPTYSNGMSKNLWKRWGIILKKGQSVDAEEYGTSWERSEEGMEDILIWQFAILHHSELKWG